MVIVYKLWTPDEVTILEAVLTLAFLPAMVTIAYVINVRPWNAHLDIFGEDDEEEAVPPDTSEVAPLEAGCDDDIQAACLACCSSTATDGLWSHAGAGYASAHKGFTCVGTARFCRVGVSLQISSMVVLPLLIECQQRFKNLLHMAYLL